ncbi:DMT family transporter [Paragemmobacter ruber]|uniref:EamA family transporter n=1 Tax=Paragemmobacter ruber TaxID=1985673 RepID=A0ABW9Y8G5_9RHOB|nr:DMT family transporter [Rhodobacter ruber]NBE08881.1 EamA family transporter [Rhodobacter ruber]
MTALSPARSPLSANLICMASMLIWAAALPAAEVLIRADPAPLPPILLNAGRMVMAAAFLLPIWWLAEGAQSLRRANWTRGIMVGSLLALGALFLVLGQTRTSAVMAAVVSSAMPLIGMTLEVIFDGRKLTPNIALGLILSIIGGVLAAGNFDGGLSFGFGALLCLASVITFTLASRWTVTALPGLSPLGSTSLTVCGAAITGTAFALASLAFGLPGPNLEAFGWTEFSALAVYGIGGLAISQLLWIIAVGRLGIAMSALHINLTPFYVMVFMLALGGTWSWVQALGAGLVAMGVLVAQGLIALPRR